MPAASDTEVLPRAKASDGQRRAEHHEGGGDRQQADGDQPGAQREVVDHPGDVVPRGGPAHPGHSAVSRATPMIP